MHLVGVFSDIHAGSTIALMGEPVLLDDENYFHPSTLQKWLWQEWLDHWRQIGELRKEADQFTLISLGDLTEGIHHSSHQCISNQASVHARVAIDCMQVPLALKPDNIHIIRGTSTHTGKGSSHEESIARALARDHNVVADPDTKQYTSYRRRIMIGDTLIDAAHHGRAGQRPWTSKSYSQIYGTEIWTSQMQDCYRAMRQNPDDLVNIFNEMRPPDISLRGHHHRYVDSGPAEDYGTRLVRCGCYQASSEFVYRIAAETVPSIGCVALAIRDHSVEVIPFLSQMARSTIVKGEK